MDMNEMSRFYWYTWLSFESPTPEKKRNIWLSSWIKQRLNMPKFQYSDGKSIESDDIVRYYRVPWVSSVLFVYSNVGEKREREKVDEKQMTIPENIILTTW